MAAASIATRAGVRRTCAVAFSVWACAVAAQTAATEEIVEPAAPAAPAPAGRAPVLKRNPRLPFYAPAAAEQVKRLTPQQSHERRFLQDIASSLRLQAQASQIVLSRTADPSVRELASAVKAWLESVQPDVVRLLNARGMALPITDKQQGRTLKQLRKLRARESDRLYVEEIARMREADLAYFQQTLEISGDAPLKEWIERQLPELRYQQELAQRALPGELARRGQRAV